MTTKFNSRIKETKEIHGLSYNLPDYNVVDEEICTFALTNKYYVHIKFYKHD